jgi:hypothetical protein
MVLIEGDNVILFAEKSSFHQASRQKEISKIIINPIFRKENLAP